MTPLSSWDPLLSALGWPAPGQGGIMSWEIRSRRGGLRATAIVDEQGLRLSVQQSEPPRSLFQAWVARPAADAQVVHGQMSDPLPPLRAIGVFLAYVEATRAAPVFTGGGPLPLA